MAFRTYVEAKTGEEIIEFIRRMKRCVVVRDAITKRFIRWLYGMQIRVSVVFESKGKKGNPLYVDVTTASFRSVKEEKSVEDIEKELGLKAIDIILLYFGGDCATGAKVAGVEHTADKLDEVYPQYHYWVVWHHYKGDEKEEEGSDVL